MSRTRRFFGTVALCIVIIAVACVAGLMFPNFPGAPAEAAGTSAQGNPYPGDPDAEAALVVTEQERIDFVKSIGASVEWQVERVDGPYRGATTPASTPLLT